ncbi:MAG TPA: glycosyltransferase [Acidimicrobiales bacterium]|nr:glycosyltransferase [Acidimicrobiales bacterium]
MRLSVALATHDGRRWLPELLASLAAQTRLPNELVVCDDASTDGTDAVLDDFAASAPFEVRRLANAERLGPVRTFERALTATDGDLVALCDQDDRWAPEKLAVLTRELDRPDVSLAFSDAELVDEGGNAGGRTLWAELGFSRRQRDSLVGSPPGPILRHAVASGCTSVLRRSVLDAAAPFPAVLDLVAEPVLHDRWLSLVAGCTGRVVPVAAPLVQYRVHPDQAVGARWVSGSEELGVQARRSAADVRARAEARLRLLDVLEDRLDTGDPLSVAVREQLTDLRRHLEVRADLGCRRSRLRPVLAQLATGGYRRFGSGPASALLDLVRS